MEGRQPKRRKDKYNPYEIYEKDGKYYVQEIQPAEGYLIDHTKKTFYVEYGETSQITWKNTPQMGQIQITKKSADDNSINGLAAGTLLPDAVFEIYSRAGNLVDTVKTDKNGRAVSKTLPLGRYVIKETKAPNYYIAEKAEINAEIEFSGQIVRLEVLNKSCYTNVSVTKRGYNQIVPGQEVRYTFTNIKNNSTVPLNSFYWRDTLPVNAARLAVMVVPIFSPNTRAAPNSRLIQPLAHMISVIAIVAAEACTIMVSIVPMNKNRRMEKNPISV